MVEIGRLPRWGLSGVALALLVFAWPGRAYAQDEVDAMIEAELFEGEAEALAGALALEQGFAIEESVLPELGAFTAAADEAVSDSSQIIGPVANATADPVLGDGEFVIRKTHLHVPGYGVPFEVALTYRSRSNHQSSLGFGWSHNYVRHVEDVLPTGGHDCEGDVVYVTEAMERITFRPVATSYATGVTSYRATTADVPLRLEKHANGPSLYVVTDGSGLSYRFNKVGGPNASLTGIADSAGNTLTIAWDTSVTNDDGGIVTRVIDTTGRNFYYNYVRRTRVRDPIKCAALGGLLGSFFDDPCRTITVAQLACVSQRQNDCSTPLVSFQQSLPDDGSEFDLLRVLDGDGHGPTFKYLSGFPQVTYAGDDQLTPACHLLCDRQSDAPKTWSCHNQDVCTHAIDNTIDTVCSGISHPFAVPAHGYSCFSYCGQACRDPNQPCYANGFDHKVDLNYISCGEEDDFDPGPDKDFWHALCECDVASDLGLCNSPDPAVQAGIAANENGAGNFCHDVASHAASAVAHAEVCPAFSAACYAKVGTEVRTDNADCSTTCFQSCRETHGATDANGMRRYAFGRPQDLDHDLVEARDGDGRLVVHNDYGEDPFEMSFDRVVKNQAGDGTDSAITYAYHDLRGEQAINGGDFLGYFEELGLSPLEIFAEALSLDGGTPVYAVHPDPANVVPLSAFGSVDVCGDSCTTPIVRPPLSEIASAGMLQLSAVDPKLDPKLDPKKTGSVWVGDPVVLAPDGRGAYTIASGPPRQIAAGDVLWASVSSAGGVRLRATASADTFRIEGDAAAIAAAFGGGTRLELRQGQGLSYAEHAPTRPVTRSRGPGKTKQPRPAVKPVKGRPSFEVAAPRATPATPGSLLSTAMARAGISLGAAPLVFERKGDVATLVAPAAGAELARAASAKGTITLKATSAPRTFALVGPVAAAADARGRVALVSLPDGALAVVPITAVLGGQRVDIGLAQAFVDGVLSDGMACGRWRLGPATTAAAVTDTQRPEHAVVVHDLHGVIRTEYYDKAWRLLRNVNRTAGETIDYNYRNGTMHGVRDAAGARTCIAADYYGKPLQVTKLPAPGAPGDATPHVSQYTYSPLGALVNYVKDPGVPTQAAVHHERDAWDRVLWIDTQVAGAASTRTTYAYDSSPQYDGHAIFPTKVVGPDGATTTLAYDPRAAGPTQITIDVPGGAPRRLFVQYDGLGRIVEEGRSGHWGSLSSRVIDSGGLATWEAEADALHAGQWLGTTVSYNASRQRFRENGPRLNRWLAFDPLDHPRTVVEVPKDGTPQKSRCERHASDGRLDYAIDPEGIVTHDVYDANNRLVRVDRGHPADLGAWTAACLAGGPAPRPFRPFPPPHPIATVKARISTPAGATTQIATGQLSLALPPVKFPIVAQPLTGPFGGHGRPLRPPPPRWPAASPRNDPGMQTITVRTYAAGGALRSEVDGSGVGKFYVRDGFGRVIDEMNADPATADAATIVHRWRGYDTQDRVIWEAALSGPNLPAYAKPTGLFAGLRSMVERQYDATSRLIGRDDWRFASGAPLGPQLAVHTSFVYDDAHRTLTTTVGSHPPRVTAFDTLGRRVSERLPDGSLRTAVWREVADGDEQDVTAPSPNGTPLTLTEHFDDRGLGTGTRQGVDELVRKTYDSNGELASTVTGQLVTTNYTYDGYGRRTGSTVLGAPSPNRVARFAYDGDDRRTAITTTNALGDHTTSFVIDGLDRVMETDAPLGRVTTRTYLPGAPRTRNVIDPAGTTIAYAYDAAGREVSELVTPGSGPGLADRATTRTFTWGAFGVQTATVTAVPPDAASGSIVTMSYDSSGHAISEGSGALVPLAVERAYDDLGGLTSTTLRPSSGAPLVLASARDPLGRLSDAAVGGRPLAHLTYAGLGAPIAIDYGGRASSPGHGPGVTARLTYDARGRRAGIDVAAGTSSADVAVARWHDAVGLEGVPRARVRQLAAAAARTDLYEIDGAGRLVAEGDEATLPVPLPSRELVNADVDAALSAAPRRHRLSLDGEANWLSVATESQTATNAVDATDAYTSFGGAALSTNAAGETVSTGAGAFVYDGLGELLSATLGATSVSFRYDALGRRVGETVTAAGQAPVTTAFVWDGQALRATADSATDPSRARVYVGGDGPGEVLAVVDGFGAGATYYVHQGGERSVFALSRDGGLAEGYLSDAFGATRAFDGGGQPRATSALGLRVLYQGQLYDPALATYAMGAREYSPALGRFLTQDPSGFDGSDNLYAFAGGMPLTRVDPTGLASQEAIDDSFTKVLAQAELGLSPLSLEEEEEAAFAAAPPAALAEEETTDFSQLQRLGEPEAESEAETVGSMPTPLTPVAEAEDSTPFGLDTPVSEPLDELFDEEATRGANSQKLWGPDAPTDLEYGQPGAAYNTLSGHGIWDEGAAEEEPWIMPEGKRLMGWGTPGINMTDSLGNTVENGAIPSEPTWSIGPGERIPPQLKLLEPFNPTLNIGGSPISNVITVPSVQSAGDLIMNGPPGDYYWCACQTRMDVTGWMLKSFAVVGLGGIR